MTKPDLPLAVAPKWALTGGLPAPEEGEGFRSYVSRLGLDPERFLDGLEGTRLENANARLSCHLARAMPDSFKRGVAALWLQQGLRPPMPPPRPQREWYDLNPVKEFHRLVAADLRRALAEV